MLGLLILMFTGILITLYGLILYIKRKHTPSKKLMNKLLGDFIERFSLVMLIVGICTLIFEYSSLILIIGGLWLVSKMKNSIRALEILVNAVKNLRAYYILVSINYVSIRVRNGIIFCIPGKLMKIVVLFDDEFSRVRALLQRVLGVGYVRGSHEEVFSKDHIRLLHIRGFITFKDPRDNSWKKYKGSFPLLLIKI